MTEGVDYSTARPSPAGLYAAGKRFVIRYGGAGTSDKWLTPIEADALRKAGLAIVANVEGTARGMMGGYSVGAKWATNAHRHFTACGMSAGRPIYLSADWDVSPSELPIVGRALDGAADVIGRDRVGIYGGRHVIEYAHTTGKASWFWQTYAWSGRTPVWVAGTHIQQYRNGVTVAGGDCDLNRALTVDYGQWGQTQEAEDMDFNQAAKLDAIVNVYPTMRLDTDGTADGRGTLATFPVPLTAALQALANRPTVTIDAAGATALAQALAPLLGQAVEDVLARLSVTVRPEI